MLELLQAFSSRCAQIDAAIRAGDDHRVSTLDSSVDDLIDAIVKYQATNVLEIYMQLQFVVYLLEQNADDCATVTNHAATLSHLLDRYFGNPVKRRLPQAAERMPEPEGYLPNMDNGNFLNSAILETLPDRVAVLTRDYRYLYSNPANCTYLGRKPIDMIGRHVAEFIGPERFAETKANFDACFAGERREYNYQRASAEGMKLIRCRMSPLRDSGGRVIGALVMMENVSAPEAVKA
ncbi:PAS domain-containing protein [Rhizobium sp. Rhizsp82]|uniref:PAS domain-containing protein n=1 Tax=Rhizobium sp. Rhizsp82 TaxID=3243057 RepID=UPI0039B69FCC